MKNENNNLLVLLIVYALANYRITNMLYEESGPYNIFSRFRALAKRWRFLGELLTCPLCISVWISFILLPFYLFKKHAVPFIFGVSGLVVALYKTVV